MSKSPIFRNIWCNTLGLIFRQMWVFCVSGPGHPAAAAAVAATTGVKWKLQMQNSKIHYYHVRRWGKCWLPIQMTYVSAMGKNIRHLLYGAVTTRLQEIKGSRHATALAGWGWSTRDGYTTSSTGDPPLLARVVAPCHSNNIWAEKSCPDRLSPSFSRSSLNNWQAALLIWMNLTRAGSININLTMIRTN